jgi:hypothetical protein
MSGWPTRLRAEDPEARALLDATLRPYDEAASGAALERALERVHAVPERHVPRWIFAAAAALLFAAIAASIFGGEPRRTARLEARSGQSELSSGDAWTSVTGSRDVELPTRVRVSDGSTATLTLEGVRVAVEPGSELRASARSTALARGSAFHSVRPGGGHYHVELGRYRAVVKGTRFWTARRGGEASVCVTEGVVEIREGTRRITTLRAGGGWRSSERAPSFRADLPCTSAPAAEPRQSASVERPPVRSEPDRVEPAPIAPHAPRPAARAAAPQPAVPAPEPARVRCEDEADPEPCWRSQAGGIGLSAETALYRLGQLRVRRGDHGGALEAWREHRARFASGVLGEEIELALLEHQLERDPGEALEIAHRFLRDRASSRQAAEVRAIRASLLQSRGDHAAALADYEAALGRRLSAPRREHVTFGRAACLDVLGRRDAADAAYRAYLDAYPSGRFSERARGRLAR